MRDDDLLTAEELAARLRVKPSTVRAWLRRGVIPAIRLSPKVIRYSLAPVVAALAGRTGHGDMMEGRRDG